VLLPQAVPEVAVVLQVFNQLVQAELPIKDLLVRPAIQTAQLQVVAVQEALEVLRPALSEELPELAFLPISMEPLQQEA
jgi:hypothetical protein